MKNLIFISILISSIAATAQAPFIVNGHKHRGGGATTYLDSAIFFFSTSLSVGGGTNVTGNPHSAIRTGTGSYSIGVTSVSTSRWTPLSSSTSSDNGGQSGAITVGYWFTNTTPKSDGSTPNLQITGLTPGAPYDIEFFGSRDATAVGAGTRYCAYIIRDNSGTDTTIVSYSVKGNTSTVVGTHNRIAKSDGTIDITVDAQHPTDGTSPYGYLGRLRVWRTPRSQYSYSF